MSAVAVAVLLGAATVGGCAPATGATRQIDHLTVRHPTIVSLNPCADSILAEVADPGQILALSVYSRDPATASIDPAIARRFHTTGGSIEEVIALRPDVVVDTAFIAPATAGAYHRLGLRLETIPPRETSIDDSRAEIRALAALAGHPERGEALIARIDRALADAAPPPGHVPVPAILWEWGGMVAGPDTLTVDVMVHAGFANAAARAGLHQADRLPLERLVMAPPRVLFTVGADRALRHRVLANLANTARVDLPQRLIYCGGPTIMRVAARFAAVRRAVDADRGRPL